MRIVVSLLVLCAVLPGQDVPREDRRSILRVLVRYARALSAQDAVGYAAETEPDASLGLPRFSLWPAGVVKRHWNSARINCALTARTIRLLSENTVLVDGRFVHVGRVSHRMLGEPGQFLAVLRKSGGAWKVSTFNGRCDRASFWNFKWESS
jgi:hypothetical protein